MYVLFTHAAAMSLAASVVSAGLSGPSLDLTPGSAGASESAWREGVVESPVVMAEAANTSAAPLLRGSTGTSVSDIDLAAQRVGRGGRGDGLLSGARPWLESGLVPPPAFDTEPLPELEPGDAVPTPGSLVLVGAAGTLGLIARRERGL